jgi:hypothetical protein
VSFGFERREREKETRKRRGGTRKEGRAAGLRGLLLVLSFDFPFLLLSFAAFIFFFSSSSSASKSDDIKKTHF